MKATEKQKQDFAEQYAACIRLLLRTLSNSRKLNLQVLDDFEFQYDHDFRDAAKQLFIEDIKMFHEQLHDSEAAVRNVKNIIYWDSRK